MKMDENSVVLSKIQYPVEWGGVGEVVQDGGWGMVQGGWDLFVFHNGFLIAIAEL